MAPRTFGTRFLAEFRRLGGSTDAWPPEAVAALAAADRSTFISLLESRGSKIDRELRVAAHTAEPEVLAQRAYARVSLQKGQGGGEMAFFPFIVTPSGE